MSKWLLRTGFVLLLGLMGFAAEYFFYSKRHDDVPSVSKDPNKTILLVGGSIIHNLKFGMNENLKLKNINEWTINQYVSPRLKTDQAVRLLPSLLKLYQPRYVFLLAGMDELAKLSDRTDQHLEVRLRLYELAKNNPRAFTDSFLQLLQSDFQSGSCDQLIDLVYFILFHHAEFKYDKPIILDAITKMLSERDLETAGICPMNLIDLANALRIESQPILGVKISDLRKNPDERHTYRKIFMRNLRLLLSEGATELERLGARQYIKSGKHFSVFERAWLVLIMYQVKKHNKPILDFLKISFFTQPFHFMFKDLRSTDPNEIIDEDSEFLNSIAATAWKLTPQEVIEDTAPPTYERNLRSLNEICVSQGVSLILLQYPGTHKKYISKAGLSLGLKVLDGEKYFKGSASAEQHPLYFVDSVDGTGHMTKLGAQLYGKGIVEQLPEIFQ